MRRSRRPSARSWGCWKLPNQQHGTRFQDRFAQRWKTLGKASWVYEFTDAAELHGLNGRAVNSTTQPADFLCAYAGWLGLVECKATKDKDGFKLAGIRQPQWVAATRSVAANTPYIFAVSNENTGEVFLVPAKYVILQRGKILWSSLVPYKWHEGVTPDDLLP